MPDPRPQAVPPAPPPRQHTPPPPIDAGAHAPQSPLPPNSIGRRPLQFSMRTLLILMTVVAVTAVLLKALGPNSVFGIASALVLFGTPVCCVTAAIYARGRWQTFFVGGACLACLMAADRPLRLSSVADLLVITINQLFLLAVGGGLAVATRRFVERRGWHLPPRDDHSNPAN